MLDMRRIVSITGSTTIDERVICNHNATIDCETGNITYLHTSVNDTERYAANLETCRAERTQFEDFVISTKEAFSLKAE